MPKPPDDRQRRADEQIVLQLAAQGFDPEGTVWRTLSPALLEYGYGVLKGWLIAGRARERAAKLGVRGRSRIPPVLKLAPDEAHELAIAVLEVALPHYLRTLRAGKWNPKKSSLASYFVGACLLHLPDVSDSWNRERQRRMAEMAGAVVHDDGRHSPDPAGQAIASRELDEILRSDEKRGVMLQLWASGYAYREIAALFTSRTGEPHSPALVRSQIFRARQQATRRRDDRAGGGGNG